MNWLTAGAPATFCAIIWACGQQRNGETVLKVVGVLYLYICEPGLGK